MNNEMYYNELARESCEDYIKGHIDLEELRKRIIDFYAEYRIIEDMNK